MKKYFIILLFLLFAVGQALADILPSGQKAVNVCAYFINTAEMANTVAVYGFETNTSGLKVSLTRITADECFKPSYKFNTYRVYGMSASNSKITSSASYVPSADPNAYITDIDLQMGTMYVPTSSTLTSVKNAYKIMRLDNDRRRLIVQVVRTEKYYVGKTDPTIEMGTATKLSDGGTSSTSGKVFTDVSSTSPYFKALTYLKENKIVSGYTDGSFKPNNTINRAEFIKIVAGAIISQTEIDNCASHYTAKNSYMSTVFKDVTFAMVGGNEPAWYFNYVCAAKFRGFISGYSDNTFRPTQNINFAEAAKILANAFAYSVNSTTPWYKPYVQQLEYKNAIPTTIKYFNQNITRGEMAEIIWRLKAYVTDQPSAKYSDLK